MREREEGLALRGRKGERALLETIEGGKK